jgi:hypothetical protein
VKSCLRIVGAGLESTAIEKVSPYAVRLRVDLANATALAKWLIEEVKHRLAFVAIVPEDCIKSSLHRSITLTQTFGTEGVVGGNAHL